MCKYCKDIDKTLNITGYAKENRIVSQIKYEGFYWSRNVDIPLKYCPNCGAKMESEE